MLHADKRESLVSEVTWGGTVIIMHGHVGMITNHATYAVHGYIVHLVQVQVNFELHMCSYAGQDLQPGTLVSALIGSLCDTPPEDLSERVNSQLLFCLDLAILPRLVTCNLGTSYRPRVLL